LPLSPDYYAATSHYLPIAIHFIFTFGAAAAAITLLCFTRLFYHIAFADVYHAMMTMPPPFRLSRCCCLRFAVLCFERYYEALYALMPRSP